jgi:uncharacterized OsmC-like protein
MSLAGCITTIFAAIAKKRRLDFQGFLVELEAEVPAQAATIQGVGGRFTIATAADHDDVETALGPTM